MVRKLPQALLLVTPASADPLAEAKKYVGTGDNLVEICEHKKPTGSAIGIFIDDIREVQQLVRTTNHRSRTVVVFADAARLTVQAQNALLKLLEEPRAGLHIILATHTPLLLLETVRSRCQVQYATTATTTIELPSDKKARILFMAADDHILQQKLATDSRMYDAEVAVFEQAKLFVSGTPFERLKAIATVKESREAALHLLKASLIVCKFMLTHHYSLATYKKTATLLDAEESLRKNANVRLSLLRCVV